MGRPVEDRLPHEQACIVLRREMPYVVAVGQIAGDDRAAPRVIHPRSVGADQGDDVHLRQPVGAAAQVLMHRLGAEHEAEVLRGGEPEAGGHLLHLAHHDIDGLHRAVGLLSQHDGEVSGGGPGSVQGVLAHVPDSHADGEHGSDDQQHSALRQGRATVDPAAQRNGTDIPHAGKGGAWAQCRAYWLPTA